MESNVSSVFESLRDTFEKQDAVRDALRERRDAAEIPIRSAQFSLSILHTAADMKSAVNKNRELLSKTGSGMVAIEAALPSEAGSFFRYADIWTVSRQTISMMAVILDFVDGDSLPSVSRVQEMAGTEFRLPLEDFLIGVCNAVSELVRLSVNRVIQMDYETPARCAIFATHIFDAFKELNFRNDFLRKRYDGVKYDVKRLEEIVYDLSIRCLLKSPDNKAGGNGPDQATDPELTSVLAPAAKSADGGGDKAKNPSKAPNAPMDTAE